MLCSDVQTVDIVNVVHSVESVLSMLHCGYCIVVSFSNWAHVTALVGPVENAKTLIQLCRLYLPNANY